MCSSFTDGKNHPVLFAGAGLFAINVFRTSAGLTKASVLPFVLHYPLYALSTFVFW